LDVLSTKAQPTNGLLLFYMYNPVIINAISTITAVAAIALEALAVWLIDRHRRK
jgi:hypothetical protein